MTHYSAHSRIYHIKSDSLDPPLTGQVKSIQEENINVISKPAQIPLEQNNPLCGLLADYNTDDSEQEDNVEPDKLGATVDNFLQEINDLSPWETNSKKNDKKTTRTAWQECYDESTGYPYYWNLETNQVTWDMPLEYKEWLTQSTTQKKVVKLTKNIVKPVDKPIVSEKPEKISLTEKPEKVVETKQESDIITEPVISEAKPEEQKIDKHVGRKSEKVRHKKIVKKVRKLSSDSEDEKIIMITSFSGEDSESETEKPPNMEVKVETASERAKSPLTICEPQIEESPKEIKESPPIPKEVTRKEIIECFKDENVDETVILSRLRTQAKVLQELDGELPESVDRLLLSLEKNDLTQSLSLVAGYGDDSDIEEEPTPKSIFPIPSLPDEPITNTESTLFPVTEPIDITQFSVPDEPEQTIPPLPPKEIEKPETVDTKAFKRKKRIGIAFDVLPSKPEKKLKTNDETPLEFSPEERKGFGFKTDDSMSNDGKGMVSSFVKGGIAFVKADTIATSSMVLKKVDDLGDNTESLEGMKEIVNQKVNFLCEGKPETSAVQVMSIQLKTLEAAHKAGGLSEKYLYSWLRETDKDLATLEQEAAPEGWLCQWDRVNRRYFYRNQQSGESQWTFPEPDIVGGGEAMDICTTPPPFGEIQGTEAEPEPPSPPTIVERSPSPPPPPIISTADQQNTSEDLQPPLPPNLPISEAPPPPPPPTISMLNPDQPLPPGVDAPDPPYEPPKPDPVNKPETKKRDSFGSELDSFYSDIAMLEATTNTVENKSQDVVVAIPFVEESKAKEVVVKKKKKSKVKLGQGITMKKKAVSTLVEKWKKVQNDYM